ncbi:DUF421 domain-containing protein [Litchfieldia salsa]|uniref:Uncharacterized membrane protein YcaP, DUF421 family n=1 Tax=Litchfieldia salsa TaxID=930152 RepID=A0A1H0WAY0_9BACI|nr:DUF421 domain-containing protein [Litchfieldia salsa]SDP87476.1 Uncharacterized membrane protein YcaP, DUF421 family [Litchfieldia salsa]
MPAWLEVVVRSLIFIVILFAITKIIGKKSVSDLSFFEFIFGISIGTMTAIVVLGLEETLFHGIIGILLFGITLAFLTFLSLKSKRVRDVVEGKATVFIKNGKIMEDNLKKEKYTSDQLLAQLRNKNVFQVADVEFALLEPTGDLSILLKKENQPLTPKDLDLVLPQTKEPQTVIMDGVMLNEPLSTIGLSRGWLKEELDKQGVAIENVFLAQVDSDGQLTLDLFDDKIEIPAPQEKPLLLATMKKCQADLEIFALGTTNQQAKAMYVRNSEKLQQAIDKMTPVLKN